MRFRLRFHPLVRQDLEDIARWVAEYAGADAAERRLNEIAAVLESLAATPRKGSVRDDIASGLRAIPAGRKAVIAFSVDDDRREVAVHAICYGGADWMRRTRGRQDES